MINLTEFLYDVKSRYNQESPISIARVNNMVCFSEEAEPSPKAMHQLKVLITLNKLPCKEKIRQHKNLRENTTCVLRSFIVGGIDQNDIAFSKKMKHLGYAFSSLIYHNFSLRLRHTLLANEPLTKEKFKRIVPILDEVEQHAKETFKDYCIKITGSGRGETSTYLDIDVFR